MSLDLVEHGSVASVRNKLMSLDLVEHGSVASVRNKKPPALRVGG